ncbi:MAG TPA: hypothetical protein VLH75_15260 [Longimicrobiales bacterium]|nr:hypothetical protein [Longimicrobiales bacterium]
MDARSFLSRRTQPAPEALAARLVAGASGVEAIWGLTDQAAGELASSRAMAGRVRESAWHLLAADALITYACEAALDGVDPPRALEELLRKAAAGEA